ncbi:hypothetical protein [uncultured Christiangramia sp.]|uniref:hypothetical protein n=1 Tax=uncultured Christiangramia sp. TaxID=503836 RepID=UPI0026266EF6|nr:hypothetical protein [uncultured Christiangramia sp.]
MEKEIINKVFEFFIKSDDFNGMPLRDISDNLDIEYKSSVDVIKRLVQKDKISIQSSSNPHIIYTRHYPKEIQMKILEDAKSWTVKKEKIGNIVFRTESSQTPICLYPSPELLKKKRNLEDFIGSPYSKRLALAEPQLKSVFFEIDVLDRYFNDPRFDFSFDDYSGSISCKYDENHQPLLREEDEIFLKTFGLGFDENGKRLAVVYLRYLSDLTSEHQVYWSNK